MRKCMVKIGLQNKNPLLDDDLQPLLSDAVARNYHAMLFVQLGSRLLQFVD